MSIQDGLWLWFSPLTKRDPSQNPSQPHSDDRWHFSPYNSARCPFLHCCPGNRKHFIVLQTDLKLPATHKLKSSLRSYRQTSIFSLKFIKEENKIYWRSREIQTYNSEYLFECTEEYAECSTTTRTKIVKPFMLDKDFMRKHQEMHFFLYCPEAQPLVHPSFMIN